MARTIQTKPRLVTTLTLGSNFFAGQKQFVDLSQIQPFIDYGNKSMLMRLTFKITAGLTFSASMPALSTLFLKYLLDKELVGPGKFMISQDRRGWHDPLWKYAQRGEIDWIRGLDIPASTTSATRTWYQDIDFEEPLQPGSISRCWPIECFKAPNAGLWLTWKSPVTIKGVTITTSTLVIQVYADVFDVPAATVPIPLAISEFALQTNSGDVNPTPGIGKYLRVMMANSPVPADNLDGTSADDLSAYTTIDYFGYQNNYAVFQQPVDRWMQAVMKNITVEGHSQLNTNTGNKGEFRLFDPAENFDGFVRAIPLVIPNKGTDVTAVPTFSDYPRLGANGNIRTGLPGGFFFLCQRIEARTDTVLNAAVGALTSASSGKSIIGRPAQQSQGHAGSDPSRSPLVVNCS